MPPAVDDEAGRTDHVQDLVAHALSLEPTSRQQGVSAKDQHRSGPADDFDDELERQAANRRST